MELIYGMFVNNYRTVLDKDGAAIIGSRIDDCQWKIG